MAEEQLRPLASILSHSHQKATSIATRLDFVRNLATDAHLLDAIPHDYHHDEHFWVTAYEEYARLHTQLLRAIPDRDMRRSIAARLALDGAVTLVEKDERAAKDSLTGAWTKSTLKSYMETFLSSPDRPEVLGLLFFDLDNFKAYNDTRGHDKGDQLLIALVEELESNFRVGDVIARVGGEEMAVFISPSRKRRKLTTEDIVRLAERVRIKIEARLGVTTSIGATDIKPDDTFETAYKRADQLMYQSKTNGKNRVTTDLIV